MKKFVLLFMSIIILTSCGSKGTGGTSEHVRSDEPIIIEETEEDENPMEEEIVEEELGFTEFEHAATYIVKDEDDTYNFRGDLMWEAEDGTIYVFKKNGSFVKGDEPFYTIHSLDEEGKLEKVSEITFPKVVEFLNQAPDGSEAIIEDATLEGDLSLYILFSLDESSNQTPKDIELTKAIVEKVDIDINNLQDSYKTETILEVLASIVEEADEDEGVEHTIDFGRLVSTTKGPMLVQQIPSDVYGENRFKAIPILQRQPEELILEDPYGIVYYNNVIYIDVENEYYFVVDEEMNLKRLNIRDGEPLYDGAYDKYLPVTDVYIINDKLFIKNSDTHEISFAHINHNLDIIDEVIFPIHEDELWSIQLIDHIKFAVFKKSEYQRKYKIDLYFSEYR